TSKRPPPSIGAAWPTSIEIGTISPPRQDRALGLVQIDHLAVDADLALGVGLDLVVARQLQRLGGLELDAPRLDLDGLARLELEPRALHLQHRALLGEPDAQLDLARRAAHLDELVVARGLDAERAALAEIDLSTFGRLLGLKLQLFLGFGRHGFE